MATYTGVVKWFNQAKGYGFISACDGTDVFLHHSQIKEQHKNRDIHEGQELTFDVIQGKKGPAAINVQKLQ